MPHDIRDQVVDFIKRYHRLTGIARVQLVAWLGISRAKYYQWGDRYGRVNEHNGSIPRDFWLEGWERQAIVAFHYQYPLEGYRRLTFMMLDRDVVAVSPSSTYRVLKEAGLMRRWGARPSRKGRGFEQPTGPHRHWHVDISYINICGTFYYLCTVLDGYSRFIVHWQIRERMSEADVEIVIQRARERFPGVSPRIITDNGPQFIARDFKEFIRITGMTHVRTRPFYPASNGKIERWHRSVKSESLRPRTPLSLDQAIKAVGEFVEHYNTVRLHSAVGYLAPKDKLEGRETAIFTERDRKLERARALRAARRANSDASGPDTPVVAAGEVQWPAPRSSRPQAAKTCFEDWL